MSRAVTKLNPERPLILSELRFLRLTLEGKNLGDCAALDVAGFPLPGRSLFVSFDLRLGPADHTHTGGN